MSDNKNVIERGEAVLGIELGSTRIKAVLIDPGGVSIASGSHAWENQLVDGIWTYSLEAVWNGLQACYSDLKANIREQYGIGLKKLAGLGISGMMHGYMAFDKNGKQLVPFRTWRNVMTGQASKELTELFNYPIPQRWSIAHLYQAILNKEEHVPQIAALTTLSGYIHWQLTGENVLGIGEASGMFPIDSSAHTYYHDMLDKFDQKIAGTGVLWSIRDILPKVAVAGQVAGRLSEAGAKLLDPEGELEPGIPMCPPEGDAGTGMVATNSIAPRTGNVSAGTSVFAMIVLEHSLAKVHPEIDLVTTPAGDPVGMVHCNNCTSDLNAWINLFHEFALAFGFDLGLNELFSTLYNKALEADEDCGGLLAYNYFSGEHIAGFEEGRPLLVREPDSRFTLANLMRTHLFSSLGTLRIGLDILLTEEKVALDLLLGHGGLFKTPKVGQSIMAAATNTPVAVTETASEGGAWGIALLAAYMAGKQAGQSLKDFLAQKIFPGQTVSALAPDASLRKSFEQFMERYMNGFPIERAAVEYLK